MYENIIELNQGLVYSIVKKFRPSPDNLADYLQIGYLGLIKSAHSFRGGSKFSVYAYKSIWWEIAKYIKKENKYKFNMLKDSKESSKFIFFNFDLLDKEELEIIQYTLSDYSVKDISDMVGKSKSTIYRILNKIEKKIEDNAK